MPESYGSPFPFLVFLSCSLLLKHMYDRMGIVVLSVKVSQMGNGFKRIRLGI